MKKYFVWIAVALLVLWIAVIFGASLKNAAESSADSRSILEFLQQFGINLTSNTVRKMAHFAEFCILGAILAAICNLFRKSLLWAELAALLVACTDECLQFFSPGRAPMIKDVALDFAGATLGILIVFVIRKWFGKSPSV